LTIKLTQHVPIRSGSEPRKTRGQGILRSPIRILRGVVHRAFVWIATQAGKHLARRASSPFHKLLCSSRICSWHAAHTPLEKARTPRAIASLFSCQRAFAPRPAEQRSFFSCAKTSYAIKNPAPSAGPVRPHTSGRIRSKLVCLFIRYS